MITSGAGDTHLVEIIKRDLVKPKRRDCSQLWTRHSGAESTTINMNQILSYKEAIS